MNYAVKQRLVFIDFLLFQYGRINRRALTVYFGISIPQATADFKMYKSIVPDNMRYCLSAKTYLKNPEFKRVYK